MNVANKLHLSPYAIIVYDIIDRLVCNQEVAGSIPAVSTLKPFRYKELRRKVDDRVKKSSRSWQT